MWSKIGSFQCQLRRIVLINLGILIGLYLSGEIALHIVSPNSNPFLGINVLRIRDPVYHHTLKPKYDGFDLWGPHRFRILSNSLGFRDASTRDVPLVADRKRVVFIGDSFTEGIGLPYEETFVGRFARAFPELDVLNAAVSSYSPSIYYEKLKHFLDLGLRFDEAVVYIDISDIRDEARFYFYDEHDVLQGPGRGEKKKAWWQKAFYAADSLNELRLSWEHPPFIGTFDIDWERVNEIFAAWTYDAAKVSDDYGSIGVEGGIQKAKRQMDRLYEVLSSHDVALSVGVYPWPQQLLYDSENSRQVKIWRDWCFGKCKKFFDHFPAFFRYKEQNPDFVRNLFIGQDVHYNARGHQVLAQDLIEKYRVQEPNAEATR